jgi:hypothetical protein
LPDCFEKQKGSKTGLLFSWTPSFLQWLSSGPALTFTYSGSRNLRQRKRRKMEEFASGEADSRKRKERKLTLLEGNERYSPLRWTSGSCLLRAVLLCARLHKCPTFSVGHLWRAKNPDDCWSNLPKNSLRAIIGTGEDAGRERSGRGKVGRG